MLFSFEYKSLKNWYYALYIYIQIHISNFKK